MVTSVTAVENVPLDSRSITNSAGGRASWVASRPIAFQSLTTAAATAKATGFDALSGLATLTASGALVSGRCQPSSFWVQPAAFSAFFDSARENGTTGSAAASYRVEAG